MLSSPEHLRTVVNHNGAVILDTKRGEMWNLNPLGAFIWQRLMDGQLPEQIVPNFLHTPVTISRRRLTI